MLDMKFVRNNPEVVKENIRKKFQDQKLPLVDEVIEFDKKYRAAKTRCDELRNQRDSRLKEIGAANGKIRQIIDLALLTNGMLKGKNLSDFIQRSISLIEK